MRKSIIKLCIAVVGVSTSAMAQQQGVGLHFGGYDFYGPQTGKYFTADQRNYSYNESDKSYDTSVHRHFYWRPMVKASYWWQVNSHVDLNVALSLASLEYPVSSDDSTFVNKYYNNDIESRREKFLAELDFRVNYVILPRARFIASPYLFAGVNGSFHDDYLGADIPLGLGVNISLTKKKDLYLNLESAYKIAATDHDQNHLQHSIGFLYWFQPGYHAPKAEAVVDMPPPPMVKDSDGDGINDDVDDCPSIAGTAQFNGCPDSDGDGISDKDDACPLVAGLPALKGCPDSDGDGISDNEDKCPYVAGTADRQGCPIPDKDGDGFNDDVDKCPDVYSRTNGGCPEIRKEVITQVEKAAKAIFFETGKAQIKKASFKSLDAVAAILKSDATLYADIEGHTDDVGDDASNMTLSQNRAQAVKDYLVSKGINGDRLTAQGFGETQPVADNKTAPGRAQNRRTVIKLRNFSK